MPHQNSQYLARSTSQQYWDNFTTEQSSGSCKCLHPSPRSHLGRSYWSYKLCKLPPTTLSIIEYLVSDAPSLSILRDCEFPYKIEFWRLKLVKFRFLSAVVSVLIFSLPKSRIGNLYSVSASKINVYSVPAFGKYECLFIIFYFETHRFRKLVT